MVRHLRCQRHPMREAGAICPSCRRPFCRECTTEVGGRMLCIECIAARQPAAARSRPGLVTAAWTAAALLGLGVGWTSFYWLGVVVAAAGQR